MSTLVGDGRKNKEMINDKSKKKNKISLLHVIYSIEINENHRIIFA